MSERERRLGENESLFREVNERIRELAVEFDVARADLGRFVCECADPGCSEALEVTGADYERVRAEPTHFFVAKGHETPDVERVVEETDAWAVVEKLPGGPAEVARAGDPRS